VAIGRATPQKRSNAYNIFVLVLTVLSLVVMVCLLLPLSEQTLTLLRYYDNVICVVFLIDFFLNLKNARKKSDYFIHERGWLDLIGSLPSLGVLRITGLLRLARLSRLARIARLLRGEEKKSLVKDVLTNRSQYAALITVLLALIVLTVSSTLVLQFESKAPDAHITTGWDAFWYSVVTITTVGYGDYYPITFWGRVTGMFIMFAGVGIIGALASILASVLVGGSAPEETEEVPGVEPPPSVEQELAGIKEELALLRQALERRDANGGPPPTRAAAEPLAEGDPLPVP
jgi:voltage-gated potassium channel